MNTDIADAIINYPVICGEVSERMNITNQYRWVDVMECFYYRHTIKYLFDLYF